MFNHDDAVDVIGHDHKMIVRHIGKMCGDLMPGRFNDLADLAQFDATVRHLTEDEHVLICDDGHEISAGLRIVIMR